MLQRASSVGVVVVTGIPLARTGTRTTSPAPGNTPVTCVLSRRCMVSVRTGPVGASGIAVAVKVGGAVTGASGDVDEQPARTSKHAASEKTRSMRGDLAGS
jgi:hypothetical protein